MRQVVRSTTAQIALLLLFTPLATAQEPADDASPTAASTTNEIGVLARVNGEPVYFEDLERLLGELHSGATEGQRGAPDLDRLMFRLVNDQLLAQEARALGLHQEEPIPTELEKLRQRLAIARLEQEEIGRFAEPTPEELERAQSEEYRAVTFRILTVYEKEEAERLLEELRNGADFATLAKEHSVDQYGPRSGLVENLARLDMPGETADEAFEASPGDLLGPIRTRIGWSLLEVVSFAEATAEQRAALEPRLRGLLRFRKREALKNDLGVRLRAAHPVDIDDEAVAAVLLDPQPDGRLLPKVENPEAMVARVGERRITAEEYGAALRQRWKGVRNPEAAEAARPLVLESLIRDELMLSEALARGYGETPEVEREVAAFETQLLIPRVLDEVVAAGVKVTREEMESYYEENKNQFRRPPRVRIGQITVSDRAEAERLAELLRQGTDLAWLARQHSIDSFRERGGDRDWVTPRASGDPVEEALFEAQPGEVIGPTARAEDFLIVKVLAREEQGIYDFQEISGNVRQRVYDLEFQRALHDYIQKLRSRSEIVLDEEALATLQITGAPEDKENHPLGDPPSRGH